eukprot:4187311-Prymnesium_polylepis.1
MSAAAERHSPYCAAKAAEPARARGPTQHAPCGRACARAGRRTYRVPISPLIDTYLVPEAPQGA